MKKLMLISAALSVTLAVADVPRVIYDTDIGSSMCDLLGLDMAVRLDQLGYMKLIGVILDRPDRSDPDREGRFFEFTDRTLVSYGRTDIPLGQSMPLRNADGSERRADVFTPYWKLVDMTDEKGNALMPPPARDRIDAQPDAVTLYRRLLNESPSNSVAICAVGFFNNLLALMDSRPDYKGDGIDKTGLELIQAKVKGLWVMAGCFNNGGIAQDGHGEYNVWTDIPSAKRVFGEWPTEIIFSPWEVGLKLEYKPNWLKLDFPADGYSTVVHHFQKFWGNPVGDQFPNRMWDAAALLNVLVGVSAVPLSKPGYVTVLDESGVTRFTPSAEGNCRYQVAERIDAATVMDFCRGICTADVSKAIPRIIVDTDLGSSVDDLLAIDLAAREHWNGIGNLIGVMMDRPDRSDGTDYETGKGEFLRFADCYLTSLGLDNVPIGRAVKELHNVRVFTPYWTLVYSNDTVTGEALLKGSGRNLETLPDAVTLYRRLLNESPSNSVEICQIGFFGNLVALMDSEENYKGDGICKTGPELIREKVRALRVMAGCFEGDGIAQDGHGEFNVWGDIESARRIFDEWPTPIVCSPWEVGLQLEYKTDWMREDFPYGCWNKAMHAFSQYWGVPPPTDHFPNRMWDVMTTLGVVFDGWVPVSPSGRIDVLDTSGITQFTHRFGARCHYQYIDCAEDAATIVRSLRKVFSDKPSAETGTKDDPWTCGDGVTAYFDNGVLVIEGRGVLASQPWEAKKDAIVDIRMDETVSGLTPRMMNVLPRLRAVNGIRLDVFNQVAAGAVTSGYKRIAVDSKTKTAKLTLSIRTAETLDAPESEWTETASVSVDVPAKGPVGYYIVK